MRVFAIRNFRNNVFARIFEINSPFYPMVRIISIFYSEIKLIGVVPTDFIAIIGYVSFVEFGRKRYGI